MPSGAGGAFVTPPDYARLILMLLREGRCDDGQVLSPSAVEAMLADRIGDVSYAAARKLGMLKSGVIEAELSVVGMAKGKKR